jgi:hypothetical protein
MPVLPSWIMSSLLDQRERHNLQRRWCPYKSLKSSLRHVRAGTYNRGGVVLRWS